jgi:uncharacterized protein (DUF1697 family)
MPELRAVFADAGFESRTYLQSGNIVLDATQHPDELAARAERLIADRFELSIPVVVRTRDQLAAVIEADPLSGEAVDEKRYQVAFLATTPPDGLADQVAALAVGGERFVAREREWYAYHPEGVARSKLATRIAARNLGVLATARNWTTVRALLELAEAG